MIVHFFFRFVYTSDSLEIVYNSWWLNQPNNARDGENCIDFRPRWTHNKALWLDSSCEDEIQSICEGTYTTTTLSTTALPTSIWTYGTTMSTTTTMSTSTSVPTTTIISTSTSTTTI